MKDIDYLGTAQYLSCGGPIQAHIANNYILFCFVISRMMTAWIDDDLAAGQALRVNLKT